LLLAAPSRCTEIRKKEWTLFASSIVLAAVAIVSVVKIEGSSLAQLIDVLLIQPMHFASVQGMPLILDRTVFGWAALSWLLFSVFFFVARVTINFGVGKGTLHRSMKWARDIPVDALLSVFFGLTAMYSFSSVQYTDVWERASPFLGVGLIPRRSASAET